MKAKYEKNSGAASRKGGAILLLACFTLFFISRLGLDSSLFLLRGPPTTRTTTTDQLRSRSDGGRSKKISTRLAFRESDGFFDDIVDPAWGRMRKHAQKNMIPLSSSKASPEDYFFKVNPSFTCPHVNRISGMGGHGRGPKWVCDVHRLSKQSDCLIYSVGRNAGEFGFEDELANRLGTHCEIHVFDPDYIVRLTDAETETKNIHYHKWGLHSSYSTDIGNSNDGSMEFKTFQESLETLGHQGRKIEILKFDCDNCEW
jgi:Methyltransferase domain